MRYAKNPSVTFEELTTTAPAPSPKKMASLRVQSVIFENVSAPTTKTLLLTPLAIYWLAIDIANRKPLQTAIISKAYGSDHKYVAIMITVTTIACLIFIPLYMFVFTL